MSEINLCNEDNLAVYLYYMFAVDYVLAYVYRSGASYNR